MDSNLVAALIIALGRALQRLLRPARSAAKLMIGAAGDLARTRAELMAENALFRQQLIALRRNIARPRLHRDDRLLLLILARLCRQWRDALHVINPETLLRRHRDLFKILWRGKSRPRGQPKRLAPEIVTLIQTMATDNALWGAERIRGEILKLGIRVSKRTVQKYMRCARPSGGRGQTWRTFISNHKQGATDLGQRSQVVMGIEQRLKACLLGSRHGPHGNLVKVQAQDLGPLGIVCFIALSGRIVQNAG